MNILQRESGCWQATHGDIVMGCTLSLSALQNYAPRTLNQVHSSLILGDDDDRGEGQEGDGLVSDRADRALVIKTADCVPITLTDGTRIGAVHAGWRGTAAGIVREIMRYFDPERVHLVIGPAISAANYEVGADMYAAWLAREPQLTQFLGPSPSGGEKRQFALKRYVRDQLIRLGVPARQIKTVPVCTYASTLPSYRRTGKNEDRIYSYVYRSSTAAEVPS